MDPSLFHLEVNAAPYTDRAERIRLLMAENQRLGEHLQRLDNAPLARAKRQIRRARWRAGRRIRAIRGPRLDAVVSLFDDAFYLRANPDVETDGIDPLAHFLKIGCREGRNPNPLFETDWYRASNGLDGSVCPLMHYISEGVARRTDPSRWFATEWYLRSAEVPEDMTPLAHYLVNGASSAASPSPDFDAARYLAENPDVAAAGANPLVHYVTVGRLEGRAVHPVPGTAEEHPADPEPPEFPLFVKRYAPSLSTLLPERAWSVTHEPFMSVVIRTQGRRAHLLAETLLCLAAQESDDYELLIVAHDADTAGIRAIGALIEGYGPLLDVPIRMLECRGGTRGRPLVDGMRSARGRYCVVLDDDDHVTADWLSSFRAAEKSRPGAVLRSGAVTRSTTVLPRGDSEVRLASGVPQPDYCSTWSLEDHVQVNLTPVHAYATPRWIRDLLDVTVDERLTVVEDWDYLIRAAMVCGVSDSGRATAIYNRGGGDSSAASVKQDDWRDQEALLRKAIRRHPILDRPGGRV